jgi:dienelactone hydrolase
LTQETISGHELSIEAGSSRLAASLSRPQGALGLVLFAHGSGSSRFSPRNRAVAAAMQRARLATLLLDLLPAEEGAGSAGASSQRIAIPLLSGRLVAAIDWLSREPATAPLPLGLFGSSTGAAVALTAAACRQALVRAVVCRGGRPDLARAALPLVRAPVLQIVGERDPVVLRVNQEAARHLRVDHQLVVIPGASHLFEEPGALQAVVDLSVAWFHRQLISSVSLVQSPSRGCSAIDPDWRRRTSGPR